MKIIKNYLNSENQNCVLTMGNFDGVHLGHQKILENVRELAKKYHTQSALLTFEPHPTKILNLSKPGDIRLSSLSQKLHFLKENNLAEIVFIANFNQKLADLKAEDFVKNILVDKLKIKHLVIGYDFVFGKNKGGNADLLEKLSKSYGFGFSKIGALSNLDQNIYSSTNIRKLIVSGNVKDASLMMGRNYQISGTIISGKKLASSLGFPTANLLPKPHLIKPKYGVYKALVKFPGDTNNYSAIVNFGIKPTFAGDKPLFEIHIFNFSKDIYGKKIFVSLLDFIREEKKFSSIEELKKQIEKDCADATL